MFDKIRRFIERGRKGYCAEDLFSWDYFFSDLIVKSLTEFKKNVQSYPSEDITWEEWLSTIDEIIECFAEQKRSSDNVINDLGHLDKSLFTKRVNHKKAKLNRGFELLEKYYYDLWD